jgi:hypothetical protein
VDLLACTLSSTLRHALMIMPHPQLASIFPVALPLPFLSALSADGQKACFGRRCWSVWGVGLDLPVGGILIMKPLSSFFLCQEFVHPLEGTVIDDNDDEGHEMTLELARLV